MKKKQFVFTIVFVWFTFYVFCVFFGAFAMLNVIWTFSFFFHNFFDCLFVCFFFFAFFTYFFGLNLQFFIWNNVFKTNRNVLSKCVWSCYKQREKLWINMRTNTVHKENRTKTVKTEVARCIVIFPIYKVANRVL